MAKVLSVAAQRVQDALKALGVTSQVVELPESTRSAAEAFRGGAPVNLVVRQWQSPASLSISQAGLSFVSSCGRITRARSI